LKIAAVRSQMKSSPLLNTSGHIKIEEVFSMTLVLKHLINPDYSLNTFFLTLSCSNMQGSPVVIIFHVRFCPMSYE
jgi:hypothetical protein